MTTSTFVFFFLGDSVNPSPEVPTCLLPEAFFSSALFHFGAGANSGRKHLCLLPAHATHATPNLSTSSFSFSLPFPCIAVSSSTSMASLGRSCLCPTDTEWNQSEPLG